MPDPQRQACAMLDSDLARLYGVSTKRLSEQVKRNRDRFPDDFMFQLADKEMAEVVAICDHLKNLRFSPVLPHAFTDHGAIMLASVLNSSRAIEVSIYVVRAFVKLRETLARHRNLAPKLAIPLFYAIRKLMSPPEPRKRKIGFIVKERSAKYGMSEISLRR